MIDSQILLDNKLIYYKTINDAQYCREFAISFFEHHPLIMPYRDVYGNVVALVGRSLLDDNARSEIGVAKYKNTTFKKARHLFGLNEAKHHILKTGFVYVVEGQFDVIKAYEAGLKNVVAVGNSNIGIYQVSLLRRYTDHIVLLFDNDEAGRVGMERAISKFGKYGVVRGCLPNGYKDLDEYLSDNSVNDFNALDIGGRNSMALGFQGKVDDVYQCDVF